MIGSESSSQSKVESAEVFFFDIKAEAKERGKERESKGIDSENKREEIEAKRGEESKENKT